MIWGETSSRGNCDRAVTSRKAFLTAVLMTFGLVLSGDAVALAATGPAHVLKDINPAPTGYRGSFPQKFHRLGTIALFQAWTPQTGDELWRTDGTEAGTALVKDICPGSRGAFDYPALVEPRPLFVEAGGALFFFANDGVHGFELWRSDGTESGTRMVKDIAPGDQSPFIASTTPIHELFW